MIANIIKELKKNQPKNKKLAFTLAEVLITLGIIGIVAEMTIPTLMQNVTQMATIASAKKAFTTFSQAYNLAVNDNGTPDTWNMVAASSSTGSENALKVLQPYFKVSNFCGTSVAGCFPYVWYSARNGSNERFGDVGSSWAGMQLQDGTSIHLLVRDINCAYSIGTSLALKNVCADLGIDINGYKGPNAFGQDYFRFWISKYGIIPKGGPYEGVFYSFANACATGNGESCTAWVIYNNNMDYLKCSGLSWSGATKCP